MTKVCKGFLQDSRHLENHFLWLTEVSILQRIEKSLPGQLANAEAYLESVIDTLEFSEQLAKIKDECALDFRGSQVHKYIFIMVRNCRSICDELLLFV